jgi:hypothetical protein
LTLETPNLDCKVYRFVLIIITLHVAYWVETETVNNISTNSRLGKVKNINNNIHFNIQHCNTYLKLQLKHSVVLNFIGETRKISLKCVLFLETKVKRMALEGGGCRNLLF